MNLGILGSGDIVSVMLSLFQATGIYHCCALCCRNVSAERGYRLVKQYHLPAFYTDLSAFLADNCFDTVYVALANRYHYDYVKKCLVAGKNVICEKPFTCTYKEAVELAELAQTKGLLLAELSRNVLNQAVGKIKNALAELGNITMFSTALCHYSRKYNDYLQGRISPVFEANSGGALRDFGIYCLHFIVNLFDEPLHSDYRFHTGFNGVDLCGVLTLEYPEFLGTCTLSKCSNAQPFICIQGTNGYLFSRSSVMFCQDAELVFNDGKRLILNLKADLSEELILLGRMFEKRDRIGLERLMKDTLICLKIIGECQR